MKERMEKVLSAYRECALRIEKVLSEPYWEQIQVGSPQPMEDLKLKERLESLIQRGESLNQEIRQRGEP